MSEIRSIAQDREPADVKDKVKEYWSKREKSFSENKHQELHSYKGGLWREELLSLLPAGEAGGDAGPLKILDVGCGSGFFEMVLAGCGFEMTGIDLTPEMIEAGKDLLKRHGGSAELLVMDAEAPAFPDGSFDAVITRNLTWTLPHPDRAYAEWHRVLKEGGVLINFDAEYAKGFHSLDQTENRIHSDLDEETREECHRIYHMLSISALERPDWDREILEGIGFRDIETDLTAGDRLFGQRDEFYMPERLFRIKAVK